MSGFLDTADAPDRQTADLDATTKKLIDDQYKRSQIDPSVERGKIDSDMSAGQDTFESGFSGANTNQAIKQKYSGLLGNKLQSMGQDQKLNSRFKQVDQLQKAQSAMLAQTQVQNDIFAKNLEANQMKEAARSQAINSILGFAGSVGGYALAKEKKNRETQQPNGTSVKHSSAKQQGPMYGNRSSYNDAPGMNQSMNYLDSLEGITEEA